MQYFCSQKLKQGKVDKNNIFELFKNFGVYLNEEELYDGWMDNFKLTDNSIITFNGIVTNRRFSIWYETTEQFIKNYLKENGYANCIDDFTAHPVQILDNDEIHTIRYSIFYILNSLKQSPLTISPFSSYIDDENKGLIEVLVWNEYGLDSLVSYNYTLMHRKGKLEHHEQSLKMLDEIKDKENYLI